MHCRAAASERGGIGSCPTSRPFVFFVVNSILTTKDTKEHEDYSPICRLARSFMISSVPAPIALTFTSR